MPEAQLLEISLIVEDELVEPVAEALARYVKGGVAIESTAVTAGPEDEDGHATGPLRVYGYLTIDETIEEKRRAVEEALWYLGRIRPLPEPSYRTLRESDWAEAWKKHYHPIPIGRRLVIVPAWMEPAVQGRVPILIDPGMAFGTGTHPTTQLCLAAVEDCLQDRGSQPLEVIDLGCGTAILAIAALKLGARTALGVDIDPDAIRAARENARANQVAERLELGLGSLSEVLAGNYSIKSAGLVLANILAPVCIRLLDEGLARLLAPEGRLVLSGILAEQAAEVEAAAQRNGLRLVEERQIEDWVALTFRASDQG